MTERRDFFQNAFRSAMEVYRVVKGQPPKFKINNVTMFSDDQFYQVIPQLRLSHYEIDDQGELFVFKDENPKYLFSLNDTERELFDLFDGSLSIDGICNDFSTVHKLSKAETFLLVKALFLRLSQKHLCFPKNLV